jgi:ABC-type transport system substrate-binding protein
MNEKSLDWRRFLRQGIVALFLLLVVGCSQVAAPTVAPSSPGEEETSVAVEATSAPVEENTPVAVEEATAEGEAAGSDKHGGVLRVAITGDALSLGSPPDLRSFNDYIMHVPVIESLGRYDESGRIVPWLATSFEEDAEARTITVSLREGVKFHDGTDFNAEAVKWNLEHFLESERGEFRGVSDIEVVDDLTVRITFETWDNTALAGLAYFAGPMISPTAFQENGKEWALTHPVGTGPFKFVSWERDVKQVYERFDDYWQEGKPYLDGFEWHIISDPVTAIAAFQAGEFDAFVSVPAQNVQELENAGIVILPLETGQGAVLQGVIGDSAHEGSPFTDVRVRQAVGHAIDSEAIVDTIYLGFGTVTNQWGLPSTWSYNPDVTGYPYDPDKARELLADAGYPDGFETTLLTSTRNPATQQMATAIQGFLGEVGIDAAIEAEEFAAYNEKVVGGTWEGLIMFSSRAEADVGLTMPRVASADGLLYTKGMVHPDEVEQLLVQLRTAADFETKEEIAHELQQLIFEEHVMINPIMITQNIAAVYPYVHDTSFNTTHATNWTPEDAWLDQ